MKNYSPTSHSTPASGSFKFKLRVLFDGNEIDNTSNLLPIKETFSKMGSDAELLVSCKVDPFETTTEVVASSVGIIATISVRKITIGRDKDNSFARFAILPNVHGQKYTFGSTYTSREEQGEFILLLKEVRDKGSFAINVENDKYFIVPGPRTTSLFVNGCQLLVQEKMELTFGDTLRFGDETHAFLFMKRELNEKARGRARNMKMDTDFNYNRSGLPRFTKAKADFAPGQNGLIVSQIMSYLPVEDIKNCRFLSKLWNDEAKQILGKRCSLNLTFCSIQQKDSDESMKLYRYSVEMEYLPLKNWKIFVPIVNIVMEPYSGNSDPHARMLDMMNRKLVDDLSWFLDSKKSHLVTKLEIVGDIDWKLGLKILAALSATLIELELTFLIDGWKSDTPPDPFPSNLKFQKLTTFTLSNLFSFPNSDSKLTLLSGLLSAISGASSIQLKKCDELSTRFLSMMPTTSFPNLNKFSSLLVTPDTIQSLLKGDKALKTLELGELKDMKPGDYLAFEGLLQKHAATLESLQFIICPITEQGTCKIIGIHLPSLPKLRHLSIGLSREFTDGSAPELTLTFPGCNGINYEEHFPTLLSLTLFPMGGNNKKPYILSGSFLASVRNQIESFYAKFFPSIDPDFDGQSQIVKSVLELDILTHVSTQYDYERTPLLSETAVTRITEMFPNLKNSDWAKKELQLQPSENDSDNSSVYLVSSDYEDSDEDNQDSDEHNQD